MPRSLEPFLCCPAIRDRSLQPAANGLSSPAACTIIYLRIAIMSPVGPGRRTR